MSYKLIAIGIEDLLKQDKAIDEINNFFENITRVSC